MSKTVISWILVGVVVVGGVWYATTHRGGGTTEGDTSGNTDGTQGTTLAQLLGREGSQKCTFTQDIAAGEATTHSVGTIYIANKQIRGDFNTTVTGTSQAVETHMIQTADTIYVWSSVAPQGFKVPAPKSQAEIDGNPNFYSAYNQALNYDCDSWTADESFFVPPTNVTFATPAPAPTGTQ